MSSSERLALLVAALAWATPARAQQNFSVERLDPAPAGAAWITMDALDMHGPLTGAASMTVSYARDPLPPIVTDEAFVNFGGAIAWDRFRFSLDLASPLAIEGRDLAIDLGQSPDVVWDPRLGFDVRFFGDAGAPLRLGWSARVFVPNGDPTTYQTDGTLRGMFLFDLAGDLPHFTWAARAGIHARERALGDEFLFGGAAGARVGAFVLGAEAFGATALADGTTGAEALASLRFEHALSQSLGMRVKLGGGPGLEARFGSPEWRLAIGVELFGQRASR